MKTLVPILLAATLAAPASVSAAPVVHFKLLPGSTVTFGPPTDACAAGTKAIDISAPGGAVIGRQHVCTHSSRFEDSRLVEVTTVLFDFGGGDTIVADATAVFAFSADFSHATFEATGRVTGGTGRYEGAQGRLAAHGPVAFDELGAPRLNVDSIIALR